MNHTIMVEIDKPETQFIEDINTSNNSSNESPNNDFSDLNETKLLRKMDLHILPVISVLYLLAYLDRGNIGNAKIEGLPESLNLSSSEYNICLTVFFLTYASFEVPSNMLLKMQAKCLFTYYYLSGELLWFVWVLFKTTLVYLLQDYYWVCLVRKQRFICLQFTNRI
ncbi:unnamed protein product [Wickerhamomyces anomalus]